MGNLILEGKEGEREEEKREVANCYRTCANANVQPSRVLQCVAFGQKINQRSVRAVLQRQPDDMQLNSPL